MSDSDLLVVGGGLSGLSLAWLQARAGRTVRVLEADARPGGCIRSERLDSGFWFELGAHTCYNSYQSLIGLLEGCGRTGDLLARQKAPFKLLVDGKVVSIASQLSFGELLVSAPRLFVSDKAGRTVRDYYGPIVGRGNYARVFASMFAAVVSQPADDFPAELMFKRRARRKDIAKSFTLQGGLQALTDALAQADGVQVETDAAVTGIRRIDGNFEASTADGRRFLAPKLALALPPSAGARLMQGVAPELATALSAFTVRPIETVGVVVPTEATRLPPMAFLVAANDAFYSAVTRDTVPDPQWRGFAFHFRTDTPQPERLARIRAVLGVERFAHVVERQVVLPTPGLGHGERVAAVERAVAATPDLAVVGNWFGGLALEDCVLRAGAESARLLGNPVQAA